jgi:hypothetical protein
MADIQEGWFRSHVMGMGDFERKWIEIRSFGWDLERVDVLLVGIW